MAAAALLLTFYQTWPASLGAAVLFGTGYGAYIAVDQLALITQVLPKARDRAEDLGIDQHRDRRPRRDRRAGRGPAGRRRAATRPCSGRPALVAYRGLGRGLEASTSVR